jgi:NAD(P)-dependent dehydrogenase (short-subunit alcohol dehydrogenase family)
MSRKIAVITGASSGFGLLFTVEMAKAGFHVVATMRDLGRRERLDQAVAVAGMGAQVDVRRLDITEFDTLKPFVEALVRDYGGLDVLVNNAGFAVAGFAEDLEIDEVRLQFETNFFGTVALTQAVLPVMRQQHSGHIILLSSIGGLHGSFSLSSYSAAKHSLEGWGESLRLELNALGIKVVLVEPGSYQTDIWTRGAHLGKKLRDGTAVNRDRGEKMREMVQKLPKKDPLPVAQLVVKIAQDPSPRLRYLIGTDARIQLWFKRLLPWKVWEKMIARAMKVDV